MSTSYDDVLITVPIADWKLEEVRPHATRIHYHPDGIVPNEVLQEADIWFTSWTGFPKYVTSLAQIPRTKVIQLTSAGANMVLEQEVMSSIEAKNRIKVCSASGIHTTSIPQWIIANIVNLYMKLHIEIEMTRSSAVWPTRTTVNGKAGRDGTRYPNNRTLFGRTVGLLGYGHIARETARLLKAFNCTVLAANSRGDIRPETGYTIEGTGDHSGSLPDQYYATTDPKSFDEFLSRSQILIASLPSTPQTIGLLTRKHLDRLPPGPMFLNVGRGDLVKSEDLLGALDAPDGLSGVALDVTDPEPLPAGHPLFTHPSAIVTGHTSGNFEYYCEAGADILIAQLKRLKVDGQGPMNIVDPSKGY